MKKTDNTKLEIRGYNSLIYEDKWKCIDPFYKYEINLSFL